MQCILTFKKIAKKGGQIPVLGKSTHMRFHEFNLDGNLRKAALRRGSGANLQTFNLKFAMTNHLEIICQTFPYIYLYYMINFQWGGCIIAAINAIVIVKLTCSNG